MSEPTPNPKPKEQVVQLYKKNERIHPKKADGKYANIRIFMIIATQLFFYGMPWLIWDGRQAVWFDLMGGHFYIFGMVLMANDLLLLTGLMMISAFGLFWWTTIAGRIWCGYSCPQTVYTEVMLWIDHLVEGDRNKRLKLDKEPWNARKIRIKLTKYLLIFAVAAWTGISFAGWFVPIREFVPAVFQGTAGNVALGTAAFYGFVTWLFGHIMREQVCLHMCPYARFQSAMFDHDTLVISYDTERGEPRGARKKNAKKEDAPLGDCINCMACVQVCPTGIDIRDGLQYQCIGCAACIDACNEIMDKMNYPRGLIRYTTEAVLSKEYTDADIKKRLLRPKVALYGGALVIAMIGLVAFAFNRDTMQVYVMKDRAVMARMNKQGMLENVYRLRFTNASDYPQVVNVKVAGLKDIRLVDMPKDGVEVQGGHSEMITVRVATQPEYARKGSHPIEFTVEYAPKSEPENKRELKEKASFIGE